MSEEDWLVRSARAALELQRRERESKLLFYRPCCRVHHLRCATIPCESADHKSSHRNLCPVIPCPDSKHTGIHLSDKRIKIILGGNRSSKSFTGICELLLTACFKVHPYRKTPNPFPGHFRIYVPDFSLLEKSILPLVKDLIPREALRETGVNKEEAWEKSYNRPHHILNLKGDSTLDFMSYDQDVSKGESVNLDGIYADEEMPEAFYTGAMARLMARRGKFIMGVTPLYSFSWAMRFLDGGDPNVDVWNLEIWDNPHIPAQAIAEFEASLPEHEKEARLHGQFLEFKGLVYKELRQDIHLIGSDEPKPGYPVVFALDPHPRKPSFMTWAFVTPKDDVVFFDELEISGTAKEIAYAIRSKEASHKAGTTIRLIDPAAKGQGNNYSFETDTLMEFEKEGMDFTLADNSEAGYNVVHEYVGYDKNLPLSSFNRPRCFFTRDCMKTWHSMTHVMWDDWAFRTHGLKDKKEKIRDYKKDPADTVRYVLVSRPTYRSFMNRGPVAFGNFKLTPKAQEVQELIMGGRRV